MHVELRLNPRVSVDMPAELEPFRGECLDVRLINLSLSGVLVEGNGELEQLLHRSRGLAAGMPLELNLHFGLEQAPIHCHCRLIHSRRLAQDQFQMGMKILSIADSSQAELSRYISSRLG
jgi:hypothetical protein